MKVILPLIIKNQPRKYKNLLIIYILGIISFLISLFFVHSNDKFIRVLLASLFILSWIIWIIGNLFVKKYLTIGYVHLENDLVFFHLNEKKEYFTLEEISNFTINITGFEGRKSRYIYTGALRIDEGSDNFIEFEAKGEKIKFLFLIKEKSWIYFIKKWVNEQIKEGKNISLKIDPDVKAEISNNLTLPY